MKLSSGKEDRLNESHDAAVNTQTEELDVSWPGHMTLWGSAVFVSACVSLTH